MGTLSSSGGGINPITLRRPLLSLVTLYYPCPHTLSKLCAGLFLRPPLCHPSSSFVVLCCPLAFLQPLLTCPLPSATVPLRLSLSLPLRNETTFQFFDRKDVILMTFQEVHEKVLVDDEDKWDAVVRRADVTMRDGKVVVTEVFGGNGDQSKELTPTPWATAQLCQRLSIPTAYFKRCPPELRDVQFNYWAKQEANGTADGEEETAGQNSAGNGTPVAANNGRPARTGKRRQSEPDVWLLRAKGDSLRGVLSDLYSRMDNAPLLSCLEPLLDSRFQVGSFALTQESMHLRLLDPALAREVLPDDRILAGIHVANSEVGKRAVTVDALVFRLVCSNGLIRLVKGKSLLHQRHLYLSERRFQGAVRQVMGEALTVAAGFIERLTWATQQSIENVDETLTRLVERWGLTQEFQEQVLLALLGEPHGQQETVYGIANALTYVAQRLPMDDRYRIEALVGQWVEHGLRSRNGHAEGKPRLRPSGLASEQDAEVTEDEEDGQRSLPALSV